MGFRNASIELWRPLSKLKKTLAIGFPIWGLSFSTYAPLPNLTSKFPLQSFVWGLLCDYQGNSLSPLPRLLKPNTALNFASSCRPSELRPLTIMAHYLRMSKNHSRPAHTSFSRTTPPTLRLIDLTKAHTGCWTKGTNFSHLICLLAKTLFPLTDFEPHTWQWVQSTAARWRTFSNTPNTAILAGGSSHSYDELPKSILRTRHGRIIHKPKPMFTFFFLNIRKEVLTSPLSHQEKNNGPPIAEQGES